MRKGRSSIYCVMFSGAALSEAACDALFQAACDCVRDEKYEKKVVHDDVVGIVHTDFDYGITGDIGGIVFEAEIETEQGDSKTKYIVRRRDLEKARHQVIWEKFNAEEFFEQMKKKSYKNN